MNKRIIILIISILFIQTVFFNSNFSIIGETINFYSRNNNQNNHENCTNINISAMNLSGPTDFFVTVKDFHYLELTWNVINESVSYQVFYYENEWTFLTNISAGSNYYEINEIQPDIIHFGIKAYDNITNEFSTMETYTIPSIPTIVKVKVDENRIKITWSQVTELTVGYDVYREYKFKDFETYELPETEKLTSQPIKSNFFIDEDDVVSNQISKLKITYYIVPIDENGSCGFPSIVNVENKISSLKIISLGALIIILFIIIYVACVPILYFFKKKDTTREKYKNLVINNKLISFVILGLYGLYAIINFLGTGISSYSDIAEGYLISEINYFDFSYTIWKLLFSISTFIISLSVLIVLYDYFYNRKHLLDESISNKVEQYKIWHESSINMDKVALGLAIYPFFLTYDIFLAISLSSQSLGTCFE